MSPPLDVQASSARCPACATWMVRLGTTEGVVAGCPRCGGIWIDHTVANLVLAGARTEVIKAFCIQIAAAATGAPAGYRDPASRGQRRCPVCETALGATTFGRPPVVIDTCARDGTFFDVHELDAVAERAEVKAIEDDREAADLGDRLAKERLRALLLSIFVRLSFR